MDKKGIMIEVRKTPTANRGTYKYVTAMNEKIPPLIPGEHGLTEVWIKRIHAADDAIVHNNVKNGHPPLTDEEKAAIKDWAEKHPGEKKPMKWNVSLDAPISNEEGAPLRGEVIAATEDSDEELMYEIKIYARDLPDRQREVFRLLYIEGMSESMVAEELGITPAAVTGHKNKIVKFFKKCFGVG